MREELGCPVANGLPPCTRMCGGGWPGTLSTDAILRRALASGKLNATKLGCGVLEEQIIAYQKAITPDEAT